MTHDSVKLPPAYVYSCPRGTLYCMLRSTETREDRTKRLFRHYTVGSYDNYTSYR